MKFCGSEYYDHGLLGCDLVRGNANFQTKLFYNEEDINPKK
jgi:hypothetical protein